MKVLRLFWFVEFCKRVKRRLNYCMRDFISKLYENTLWPYGSVHDVNIDVFSTFCTWWTNHSVARSSHVFIWKSKFFPSLDFMLSPWTIRLKITNEVHRDIILFSDDNEPPQGFKIKAKYEVTLTKVLNSKQKIRFHGIEEKSHQLVLLNGQTSIKVEAKQRTPMAVSVTITGMENILETCRTSHIFRVTSSKHPCTRISLIRKAFLVKCFLSLAFSRLFSGRAWSAVCVCGGGGGLETYNFWNVGVLCNEPFYLTSWPPCWCTNWKKF